MSKKYKTTTSLVIVESPAKCKKIEEYLGPGYKCVATYGHLRTLASLKDIDIENNFNPTFSLIEESLKKKQFEVLRKAIKDADDILLSSDDDREGEAIAWHLSEILDLPEKKLQRVEFNEITKEAVLAAMKKLDAATLRTTMANYITPAEAPANDRVQDRAQPSMMRPTEETGASRSAWSLARP